MSSSFNGPDFANLQICPDLNIIPRRCSLANKDKISDYSTDEYEKTDEEMTDDSG
jgi:hypothetical protein